MDNEDEPEGDGDCGFRRHVGCGVGEWVLELWGCV